MSNKEDGSVFYTICGVILIYITLNSMCNKTDTYQPSTKYSMMYDGRELLKAQLVDPDSLQIINEEVIGNQYHATFRSKNGFGGYVVNEVWYDVE